MVKVNSFRARQQAAPLGGENPTGKKRNEIVPNANAKGDFPPCGEVGYPAKGRENSNDQSGTRGMVSEDKNRQQKTSYEYLRWYQCVCVCVCRTRHIRSEVSIFGSTWDKPAPSKHTRTHRLPTWEERVFYCCTTPPTHVPLRVVHKTNLCISFVTGSGNRFQKKKPAETDTIPPITLYRFEGVCTIRVFSSFFGFVYVGKHWLPRPSRTHADDNNSVRTH